MAKQKDNLVSYRKRKRPGRPASTEPRRSVQLLLTDQEIEILTAAAKSAGAPRSVYIRVAALAAARADTGGEEEQPR